MEEGRRRANRFLQSSSQTPQPHREREMPHWVLSGKEHKLSPADSVPRKGFHSAGTNTLSHAGGIVKLGFVCLFELNVGFGMEQARELCCSINHWTVSCLLSLHALSQHPCSLMRSRECEFFRPPWSPVSQSSLGPVRLSRAAVSLGLLWR